MEITLDFIEKVKSDSHEFRRLYDEHLALKLRINEINKWRFLTPKQEIEKKTIQKKKLQKKDRMNEILDEYENSLRSFVISGTTFPGPFTIHQQRK